MSSQDRPIHNPRPFKGDTWFVMGRLIGDVERKVSHHLARPDDTEVNQEITKAEDLGEAIWALGDKYNIPLTNNSERWENGVFLRHVGDFREDVESIMNRFLHEKREGL